MSVKALDEGYLVTQEDYIQDVLDRNGVKGVASTPMSRDVSDPGPEEDITAEEVQAAQRIVGELMWLVTRCRADLAYTVAKMASQVARTPRWVVQVGEQALKYLNGTKEEGLLFSVDTGTDLNGRVGAGLEVATDASFAPGGGLSHGCVMVKWMGSVVAWRSSKQSFPALSTAECELMEMIEGMIVGDSVDAMISELEEDGYMRSLQGDNQAAIALCSEEAGSWRTRHLRLRAFHVRWRIQQGDWRIAHKAGSELIADMGTKALAGPKLKDLKKKAGMMAEPQTKVNRINEVKLDMVEIEKYKQALAVIACCLQVQGTSAMEDEKAGKEEDEALIRFGIMVAVFTVIAMKIVEKCGAACSRALPVVRVLRVGREREVDSPPRRLRDEQADAPEEVSTRSGGEEASGSSTTTGGGEASGRLPTTGSAEASEGWSPGERASGSSSTTGGGTEETRGFVAPTAKWNPGRYAPKGKRKGKRAPHPARPTATRRRDPEPEPEDDEIPVEPSVFYTDRGEKYHLRENCYGLRLATRVRESLPCPRCMTPDFRRLLGSTVGGLYIGRNGHYHSVMMCAGREGIEYNEYDMCRYCLNGDVVVD